MSGKAATAANLGLRLVAQCGCMYTRMSFIVTCQLPRLILRYS